MSKPSRNIPKGLRNAVWNKYIGIHNADGPCWCKCGIIINITNFEVATFNLLLMAAQQH